jgi:O-antigen/teichoic acid export membrane protein
MQESLTRTLVRGEAAFGFWNVATKGVGVINAFIILKALSFFHFGVYQLFLSALGIAGLFLLDGFNAVVLNDVIRFGREGESEKAKRLFVEYVRFKLVAGTLLAGLAYGVGVAVSRLYDVDIGILIQILSPVILAESIMTIIFVFLRSQLRFGVVASQGFFREVAKLALIGWFFFTSGITIRAVIIAFSISGVFMAILVAVWLYPSIRTWLKGSRHGVPLLRAIFFGEGKWAIGRAGVKDLGKKLNPWLIKVFISTEAVSFFSVAMSLVDLIQSFFPGNLLSSIIPREFADRERLRYVFVRGLKYTIIISLLLTVLGFVIVPLGVSLALPKYLPALPLFFVLGARIVCYAVGKMAGAVLTAARDQRFLFNRMLFTILITLALAPFVYPALGIWGAVLVSVLNAFVAAALFLWRAVALYPSLKPSPNFLALNRGDLTFLRNIKREVKALKNWKA